MKNKIVLLVAILLAFITTNVSANPYTFSLGDGNATTVTVTDDTSTNATMYFLWVTAAGSVPLYTSTTGITYNPSTQAVGFPGAISGIGSITVDGNATPYSADGGTLGSVSNEWSDLYLADGGVVYFQNDQSVYLTPSAGALALIGRFSASGGTTSLTPVTDSTADFATNFTGANLYGGTFLANADDGDLQLPAAAVGMNFTIITLGTIEIVMEPNASDSVILDGVQLDDADSATNTSTAGDIITCQYYSADGWLCVSNGWTDED